MTPSNYDTPPTCGRRSGKEILAEMQALRVAEPADPAFAEPPLPTRQNWLERWLERRTDREIDRTRPARQAKIQASRLEREAALRAEQDAALVIRQRAQQLESTHDPEQVLVELQNRLMQDRQQLHLHGLTQPSFERARKLIHACLDAIHAEGGTAGERAIRTCDLIEAASAEIQLMTRIYDQAPIEPVSDDFGLTLTCLFLLGLAAS